MNSYRGGGRARGIAVLGTLLAVLVLCSLTIGAGTGSDSVGPWRALRWLVGADDPRADLVVGSLRMPRTFAALLVGACLGLGGCMLRTVTRNGLAEPGLLGVNAGASLGLVVGITFFGSAGAVSFLGWSFAGALVASSIVLVIAAAGRVAAAPLRLVLAGVALGTTLAGIRAAVLLRNPVTYDQFRFWTLGSLSGTTPGQLWPMLPPFVVAGVVAVWLIRPLSALSLGDESAASLGVRPGMVRLAVAGTVSCLAAIGVAVAGPVAFVGLVAPYLAQVVARPALAAQMAASALLGPAVLIVADIAGRLIIRPFELPAGVVLAVVGAPILIRVARSTKLSTRSAG